MCKAVKRNGLIPFPTLRPTTQKNHLTLRLNALKNQVILSDVLLSQSTSPVAIADALNGCELDESTWHVVYEIKGDFFGTRLCFCIAHLKESNVGIEGVAYIGSHEQDKGFFNSA